MQGWMQRGWKLVSAGMLLLLVACSSVQPDAATEATVPAPSPAATIRADLTVVPADTPPTAVVSPSMAEPSGRATPTRVGESTVAGRGLFVNLTTDDTWSAHTAINMAQTGVDQGLNPVVLFLNVRAVYLADRKRLPATESNSDLNTHQKLQAFIAAGGQVLACPSCSREAGLTQTDYIDGVMFGEPGGAFDFLNDPTITVISYTERNRD